MSLVEMSWPNVLTKCLDQMSWPNVLTKCLLIKCLLIKYMETKCLLTNYHFTTCLLTKCLSTKMFLIKSLLYLFQDINLIQQGPLFSSLVDIPRNKLEKNFYSLGRTGRIRQLCRKTTVLRCHRILFNTGIEKLYI
jgi:hypothetical protein